MAKYCSYIPGENPVAYVNGWYDMDIHPYQCPPGEVFLELSEQDFEKRFEKTHHWAVRDGCLVPSPHRPAPVEKS